MPEANPRIVILEDDEALCQALALFFARQGFDVFPEHDAARGVAAVVAEKPLVILLDLGLPGGGGLSVIHELHAMGNTTPILVLTGDAKSTTVRQVATAGVAGYLRKPAEMSVLLARVRKLIEPEAAA